MKLCCFKHDHPTVLTLLQNVLNY